MKLILSILFLFWLPRHAASDSERWVVGQQSHICIEGKTNINDFRCDIFEYLPQDTLVFVRNSETRQPLSIRGGIKIDIKKFDCHQRYITNDLRKTLKADQKPCLYINLLSISYFDTQVTPQEIKGWVDIELAGVKRKIDVSYRLRHLPGNGLELTGTRALKFSDFGLTPPRKLAGLVRVEEQINVQFQLILHPV